MSEVLYVTLPKMVSSCLLGGSLPSSVMSGEAERWRWATG